MPLSTFDDIFNNIKKLMNKKNQREVAAELGITASAITDAKGRNTIPDRWFETIKEKFGITKEELCETPEEKLVRTYGKNPITSSTGLSWKNEMDRPSHPSPAGQHEPISMPDMVKMTMIVLESETVYRSALASNVRAFYEAVMKEDEMRSLNEKIEAMQHQMKRMEEMLLSLGASLPEKREQNQG
ncbi:MAG: hypothetical protein VR65_06075 [Desulfobulbaceae bacterium BRH_c16a]|nr:MAG: hypothetical protein VR65_06075 [Desulfobulbaceae bacterium BRH_c16a]